MLKKTQDKKSQTTNTKNTIRSLAKTVANERSRSSSLELRGDTHWRIRLWSATTSQTTLPSENFILAKAQTIVLWHNPNHEPKKLFVQVPSDKFNSRTYIITTYHVFRNIYDILF